ncbi:probable xyloglucan endotransglucosylase/hydrolase protein 6 isoform X2 [Chenopodium quinoa]|uniref:probable xyloglucan endotransglucosylase/hydrolase protein 6 isoform X2 n=1 Tax=Chenopodium quinoa TaxID=63459 RepID=UPI000B77A98B|nr:probable xyloglucan endotransglucosylase/hydrolase protein 6 isoform X2 [Chenopodium quinoa]
MSMVFIRNVALVSLILLFHGLAIYARPATFQQDFKVTWADSHLKLVEGCRAIQLILDRNSGCGFASKYKYMYGRISMKIKLVAGDSAGTVTAFYMNSDTDTIRDELDFEFLGNRTGHPYTVQTNIFAHGKGNREQRVNLWFDPSADYHTYSILWNHHQIVWFIPARRRPPIFSGEQWP